MRVHLQHDYQCSWQVSPDVVGPAVVGGAVALVTAGILAHAMTYYSAITEIVSALRVWVITLYGLVMELSLEDDDTGRRAI